MIQLNEIYKKLDNRNVLNGVTLRVAKGETMVIVGASGTGKSVTLKHILGLMKPDRGAIFIGNEDIILARGRKREQLLEKFGVLFQSGALINWMSVFDNIALPLYERTNLGDTEIRKKVLEKLELVELSGCERKFPSEISGGMKKRAALARAIIMEPEIILYDEPTSGLDPVMSRTIDDLIISMQKNLGVTSVVVTHDLVSAVAIGSKIAMLYEGKVVEVESPEKFINSEHSFVQSFINAQFGTERIKRNPVCRANVN